METGGSIAHQQDHRCVRTRNLGGDGIADAAAYCARHAVDDARRGCAICLRPLAEFAAVANKNGVLRLLQQSLNRVAQQAWADFFRFALGRTAQGTGLCDRGVPVFTRRLPFLGGQSLQRFIRIGAYACHHACAQ
ncbi:hypothetical protein D3C71_1349940 [compost metagenome]